jgi:SAM-dependent methyltransferase
MSVGLPRERRLSFGSVADLYEAARPSYPAELVEDVVAYAGLQQTDRILEVGAGTGKATRLFAALGHAIAAHFLDAPAPGPVEIAVEVLRRGKRVASCEVRMRSGDRLVSQATIVCSAARSEDLRLRREPRSATTTTPSTRRVCARSATSGGHRCTAGCESRRPSRRCS